MPRFAILRPKGLVTMAGVTLGVAAMLGARPQQIDPTQVDRVTARLVAELIQHAHLAKPEIDDTLSEKWHALYIEALDPQKLYFLKGDVAEFEAARKELDDQIRKGDLSFAKSVFERYVQRRKERLAFIEKTLDAPIDFTVDEVYVDDPDQLDFPVDEAEADERWRKELKYQVLVLKLNDEKPEEATRRLRIRYRDNNRVFEKFDTSELLEVYLTSMARAIDPHSDYMNWKSLEDMTQQTLHLSLEGIGATLGIEDGVPVIKGIVPGGAADKDGRLHNEDKIIAVEKEDGTLLEFSEMKISDVVRHIRGPRGTKVKLIVQPTGTKERKTFEITREKIELADQRAQSEIIEAKAADGRTVKVGVIDLSSFYGDTAAVRAAIQRGDENAISATFDVKRVLNDFKKQGVECVLLDLRKNGGGLLLEAISLSGLFIDKGPVVRVRDGEGVIPYDDEEAGTAWDGPLAVLISKYSASASEIFAGVIKDYNRGLIIGDSSTYGKGTVQSVIELNRYILQQEGAPNLGALKLTIQQFYRANGMSTQVKGVSPDLKLPSIIDHIERLSEADQDNALKFDQIDPLEHDHYGQVPADLVAQLDTRSAERRSADEKFQKQARSIAKLLERQKRHQIPLKEEAFLAEFADEEKESAELNELKDETTASAKKKEHVWNRESFYNNEVMAIIADYVTLGEKTLAAHPVPGGPGQPKN
jgi:carboxyl-terminal processing protease